MSRELAQRVTRYSSSFLDAMGWRLTLTPMSVFSLIPRNGYCRPCKCRHVLRDTGKWFCHVTVCPRRVRDDEKASRDKTLLETMTGCARTGSCHVHVGTYFLAARLRRQHRHHATVGMSCVSPLRGAVVRILQQDHVTPMPLQLAVAECRIFFP